MTKALEWFVRGIQPLFPRRLFRFLLRSQEDALSMPTNVDIWSITVLMDGNEEECRRELRSLLVDFKTWLRRCERAGKHGIDDVGHDQLCKMVCHLARELVSAALLSPTYAIWSFWTRLRARRLLARAERATSSSVYAKNVVKYPRQFSNALKVLADRDRAAKRAAPLRERARREFAPPESRSPVASGPL